jgi:hypothetical protein
MSGAVVLNIPELTLQLQCYLGASSHRCCYNLKFTFLHPYSSKDVLKQTD